MNRGSINNKLCLETGFPIDTRYMRHFITTFLHLQINSYIMLLEIKENTFLRDSGQLYQV